jgi:hypothetical protein
MKGVYLIQLEDDDVEEALEEDLHISLQAITGISNIETMQLGVAFNNASVRALVDSGSTYSFLSVAIAKRHQLQPFSIRLLCDIGFYVTLAWSCAKLFVCTSTARNSFSTSS